MPRNASDDVGIVACISGVNGTPTGPAARTRAARAGVYHDGAGPTGPGMCTAGPKDFQVGRMHVPEKLRAMGLPLFWPLHLGARPCGASNPATSPPRFAPGATPSPPINPAQRSEMMSP